MGGLYQGKDYGDSYLQFAFCLVEAWGVNILSVCTTVYQRVYNVGKQCLYNFSAVGMKIFAKRYRQSK